MAKVSDPWSNRQQRHLAYVSEFTTDIRHIQGKDNHVADALSRATINALHEGVDYAAIAASQRADPDVQAYCTAITGLKLENVQFGPNGATLLCDTSTGQPRPIIPVGWRRKVFDLVHGLSHPSVRATRQLMANKFVWHGLRKQVGLWAKACIPCQTSKVQRHIRAPLENSTSLLAVSTTSTWIWLAPSHLPVDTHTSSRLWTVLPAGQRQFLSVTRPPSLVPKL